MARNTTREEEKDSNSYQGRRKWTDNKRYRIRSDLK